MCAIGPGRRACRNGAAGKGKVRWIDEGRGHRPLFGACEGLLCRQLGCYWVVGCLGQGQRRAGRLTGSLVPWVQCLSVTALEKPDQPLDSATNSQVCPVLHSSPYAPGTVPVTAPPIAAPPFDTHRAPARVSDSIGACGLRLAACGLRLAPDLPQGSIIRHSHLFSPTTFDFSPQHQLADTTKPLTRPVTRQLRALLPSTPFDPSAITPHGCSRSRPTIFGTRSRSDAPSQAARELQDLRVVLQQP